MADAIGDDGGRAGARLELPDTEGELHALPAAGAAPATVVFWTCNHCPYALAWHDRLVDVGARLRARAASASSPSTPTTPSVIPRDSLDAMRERVEREDWPFPYLHDETRRPRAPGALRSRRTSTSSTATAASATRARPTPTTWTRAGGRLAARRARRGAGGRRAGPADDRARRLLDQVEGLMRVTERRRLVRVPASSANLGPGFDVLAAALALHLELEVEEAGDVLGRRGRRRPSRSTARTSACARSRRFIPPTACGSRSAARSRSRAASARAPRRSSPACSPPTTSSSSPSSATRSTRAPSSSRATPTTSPPRSTAASSSARAPRAASAPPPVRLEPPQGVEGVLVIPDERGADRAGARGAAGRGPVRRRGRQRRRRLAARPRDRALRPRR